MSKNKKIALAQHPEENNTISLYIKKGDGSKFKFIENNKYVNIKMDQNIYSSEVLSHIDDDLEDGQYVCIKFSHDSSKSNIKKIADNIEEMMLTKKSNETYEDILKNVIEYFETISSEQNIQKIRGDIGEALFILKCFNLNVISNIKGAIKHKEDNDNLDFTFKNGETIEVKTTTKIRSAINIGEKQTNIENDNCNIVVIKVNSFERTKIDDNYLNILEIYDRISNFVFQNTYLSEKRQKYQNSNSLVEKNYVNINDVTMQFLKKEYIPIIKDIKNDEAILEIKFILDASLSVEKEEDFENKLKLIVNK